MSLLVCLFFAQVAVLGGAAGPLDQAKELKNQKKYPEAEAILKGEVQKNPNDVEAQRLLGWVCAAQGKKAEAKTAFQAAMKLLPPTDPKQKEIKDALARLDKPAPKAGKAGGSELDKMISDAMSKVKSLQGDVVLNYSGTKQTPQGPQKMNVSGKFGLAIDVAKSRGRVDVDLKVPPEIAMQIGMMIPGLPTEGGALKGTLIAVDDAFYALFPAKKSGYKITSQGGAKAKGKAASPMPMPTMPSPVDLTKAKDDFTGNMKKVGTETLNGEKCNVYAGSEPGKGSGKLWVRAKDSIPLKLTFDDGGQGSGSIELKNSKVNQPLPASATAVPSGYKIEDFAEVMVKSGMTGKGKVPGKVRRGKGPGAPQ